MARGVNKVILLGILGKDPELRYTPSGMAVAKFSLATNENKKKGDEWEEVTEWHNIVLFDKTAETASKFLSKGKQVFIEGKIHYDNYEKEGVKTYFTQIIGERITLVGTKSEGGGRSDDGGGNQPRTSSKSSPPPSRMAPEPEYSPEEESDLPF